MKLPIGYYPNNAFSFSFYKRKKNGQLDSLSKVEYPFVNGPSQYTENFKFRIYHEPTFGGTSVSDMGVGNSDIKLDGEFHIWHSGIPADTNRSGAFGAAIGAIKDASTKYLQYIPGLTRSGVEEFQDFIFMAYGSRLSLNYVSTDPLIAKLKSLYAVKQKFNFSDFGMVFSDYDRQRFVEVIIPDKGFSITRGTDDTNTFKFSINLTVIRDMDKAIVSKPAITINPAYTISGLIIQLENIINSPLKLTGTLVRMTQFIDDTITSLRKIPTTYENMKKSFTEDGKLIRKNFQAISENIEELKLRKVITQDDISNELNRTNEISRTAEAQFMQELKRSEDSVDGLNYTLATYTVPVYANGSYEFQALTPDADFTEWIDNDVYTFILDVQEILFQINAAMEIAFSEETYRIHEVSPGETWDSIAESILGSRDLGQALSVWNDDTIGELSKNTIRIPLGADTGIYDKLPQNPSRVNLESVLLGADIKLTKERDIAVAPNGDIALVYGDECLLNNILDIIDIPQKSWIANLEIGNPIPIGEIPNTILNGGYIFDLLAQLQNNRRIEKAEFSGLEQDGDSLLILFNIFSISGGSYIIDL